MEKPLADARDAAAVNADPHVALGVLKPAGDEAARQAGLFSEQPRSAVGLATPQAAAVHDDPGITQRVAVQRKISRVGIFQQLVGNNFRRPPAVNKFSQSVSFQHPQSPVAAEGDLQNIFRR